MPDTMDILKLRILICFLKMSPESCTVTNLAKTFAVEKYTVSRAMIHLAEEGLLNRSDSRCPKLTPFGAAEAAKYADRMDIAINHLLYEGVDTDNAQADAMYLTRYCSDNTFRVIQAMEERYRMKYALRNYRTFDGATLCRELRDGSYSLPFIIYRENVKKQENISMANEGFEHPCELSVKRGSGIVRLKSVPVIHGSASSGKKIHGKISSLKYFDGDAFRDAEQNGDFIQFPAESLRFLNIGSDSGRILHGSLCLKMTCTAGLVHMPESTAIFTILL